METDSHSNFSEHLWTSIGQLFRESKKIDDRGITLLYPNLKFLNEGATDELSSIDRWNTLPEGKPLTAGRVGEVYLVGGNILKIIKGLTPQKHISTDFVPIDDTKKEMLKYNVFKARYGKKSMIGFILLKNPSFVNQTIIHNIIEKIVKPFKINGFVKQYYARYLKTNDGICGINELEYANSGDLLGYLWNIDNNILISTIKAVMHDVLTILGILKCKRFLFCHNDLKIGNIFVNKTNDKTTFKIADYDKSSIFLNGFRFRFGGTQLSAGETAFNLADLLTTKYGAYNLHSWYGTVSGDYLESTAVMFGREPIHMSYDIYVFVISLILHPTIIELFGNEQNRTINDFIQKTLGFLFDPVSLEKIIAKIRDVSIAYKNSIARLPPEKIQNEKKKFGKQYSSLKEVVRFLADKNINLLVNIDEFYKFFGVSPPSDYDKILEKSDDVSKIFTNSGMLTLGVNDTYVSAGGSYHICTSECSQNKCQSNAYSMTYLGTKKYDTSYCKN